MAKLLIYESLRVNLSSSNWTGWDVEEDSERYWIERIDTKWWIWFEEWVWLPISIAFVALYIYGVQSTVRNMKEKEPVGNLASFMVSFFLLNTLFSVACAYRTFPRLIDTLYRKGLYGVLCIRENPLAHEFSWVVAYNLTKPIQLLDTFFLILQKKKITTFHLYHHSAMLLTVAAVTGYWEPFTYFMMIVNVLQHIVVYPFLVLKVLKVSLPNGTPTFILIVELLSMLVGIGATVYTVQVMRNGRYCARHPMSVTVIGAMMAGMLVLVVQMLIVQRWQRKIAKKKVE